MSDARPNPDDLLARVQAEENPSRRGRLKIFFGYAAGVGKTFAMLQAAQREKIEGVDVVVGYVEPHGRAETEVLVEGLERLPPRAVPYRSVTLQEFDLDAALLRHPALILVDELAHTNAEGSRHAKRWQDVEELLAAGIDVYSTLNVQHVESLNDVVAQITGVVVRETLPDSVLERADELELIDITPEELIDRLNEGKVYVPQQAQRALQNFFQRGNLLALREISLRRVAERLNRDVTAARQQRAAAEPWATSERLLVCVGPSPTSAKLIRAAKRMASAFGGDWLAVAVEPQGRSSLQGAMRQQVAEHLRLADQLGAESHTLLGDDVAQTLLDFARSRNVTKIVVGKSDVPYWKRLVRRTVVDSLLERSGDIDIYVIRGESTRSTAPASPGAAPAAPLTWGPYFRTAAVVAFCGILGWMSHSFRLAEANTIMVFLLGVGFVAARYGRGPSIFAAIASVLVFDFFFVQPYFKFSVSDAEYVLTFAVMLVIGLIISTLTSRLQEQLHSARQLQQRTAALYRLTKQLTEVAGSEFLIRSAGQQLEAIFDGEAAIYLREADRSLTLRFGEGASIATTEVNSAVAHWVADHDQVAGAGTDTLPNATALFVPLTGSQRTLGAVGVRSHDPERFLDPDQRRLFETCASLIALSLERDLSVLEAGEATLRMQTEEIRSSLLSSVSHDLRTPLAVIAAASSNLLNSSPDESARTELLKTIESESRRLSRLVENLLDMTRLESQSIELNRQWHVLEEIVGSALRRLKDETAGREIHIDIPSSCPLVFVDGLLLEQAFVNLLENAVRYTPAQSPIEITARHANDRCEIRFADRGPGIPHGFEEKVFEKFCRGQLRGSDSRRGVGLGLAICHAIVRANGGRIHVRNRPDGGAEFVISLRNEKPPPDVVLDEVGAASAS